MENNRKKIVVKKLEIKAIIDDFRKIIEVYGSNYSEKTANIFKKCLKNKEDLYCDEEDDSIEDSNICIRSLNSLKNDYFGECVLVSSTFIKTPKWLALKRSVLNPNNNNNNNNNDNNNNNGLLTTSTLNGSSCRKKTIYIFILYLQ